MAILISNKLHFKPELIKRDEDGHFVFTTREIHQHKVLILNIYAPNTKAPTFVKETLLKLKAHIKPVTLVVGEFNTPLSPLGKTTNQKLNKETKELTEVMSQ